MVLDVAKIEIEGELVRSFDEIEGHRVTGILLKPDGSLARQRSPVLRALEGSVRIQVEPSYH